MPCILLMRLFKDILARAEHKPQVFNETTADIFPCSTALQNKFSKRYAILVF